MEVHVFSNNKKASEWFAAVQRSRKYSVEFHGYGELKEWVKRCDGDSFVYLDIQNLDEKEIAKALRLLASKGPVSAKKNGDLRYGILDPKGALIDAAALFHQGAVDYVGKRIIVDGLDTKRVERAVQLAQRMSASSVGPERETTDRGVEHADVDNITQDNVGGIPFSQPVQLFDHRSIQPPDTGAYRYSGNDWAAIKPDTEYTFWFAYVNLGAPRELAGRQSSKDLSRLISAFQKAMGRYFSRHGGRIWMWKDFSGLVLFPFDGVSLEPLLAVYRFLLNQNLINAENLGLSVPASFQIALDIGNTTYREAGKTGTIISDSVNFIFHLGQKFAPEGALSVTGRVIPFVPERMARLVQPLGKFEERFIFRLQVPKPL